jgi:hypothetical protein
VKNAFDEWRVFCSLDTSRSIIDLSKDESSFKDLVDMLSSFVLQVAKRMVAILQFECMHSKVAHFLKE